LSDENKQIADLLIELTKPFSSCPNLRLVKAYAMIRSLIVFQALVLIKQRKFRENIEWAVNYN
jgi:hypothetical protein